MLIVISKTHAQNWEVGVSAGGSGYIGDLNQRDYHQLTDLAIGGMVKKNLDGYWALKFSLLKGKVRANDADSKYEEQRNRNLSFYSPITEGSLQVEFNFFDFGVGFGQRRVSPYVFLGISYFGFNPQTELDGRNYELKLYGTELNDSEFNPEEDAYKTTGFAIPLGTGIKYRISNHLNISGEFGFRTTRTDYIDDVSARYPLIDLSNDLNVLRARLSDKSGNNYPLFPETRVQRGDFRKRDTYMFALLTISYVFRNKNCPF